MRDNDAVREHYRHRFQHILVDEFQDTNRLQYAWLKMFAGPHGAVFAVGDDDQSIYGFRGALVGNMADFEREFNVDKVIKLEQNYRSFGNILDAANHLIDRNSKRLGKNLRTDQGPGELVRIFEGRAISPRRSGSSTRRSSCASSTNHCASAKSLVPSKMRRAISP